jgi:hypothetical protein
MSLIVHIKRTYPRSVSMFPSSSKRYNSQEKNTAKMLQDQDPVIEMPKSMAMDSAGMIYILDSYLNCIRMYTSDLVYTCDVHTDFVSQACSITSIVLVNPLPPTLINSELVNVGTHQGDWLLVFRGLNVCPNEAIRITRDAQGGKTMFQSTWFSLPWSISYAVYDKMCGLYLLCHSESYDCSTIIRYQAKAGEVLYPPTQYSLNSHFQIDELALPSINGFAVMHNDEPDKNNQRSFLLIQGGFGMGWILVLDAFTMNKLGWIYVSGMPRRNDQYNNHLSLITSFVESWMQVVGPGRLVYRMDIEGLCILCEVLIAIPLECTRRGWVTDTSLAEYPYEQDLNPHGNEEEEDSEDDEDEDAISRAVHQLDIALLRVVATDSGTPGPTAKVVHVFDSEIECTYKKQSVMRKSIDAICISESPRTGLSDILVVHPMTDRPVRIKSRSSATAFLASCVS